MTPQQQQLHELRKEIDGLIKKVGSLKNQTGFSDAGREISLSYTHLQEGKMWLGQALGIIGSELPQQYADKA